MTQEFASGEDLMKIMRASGRLPLRRAITITRQLCEGLAYAHARGIVHRDIKPGNIVIDHEDRVKIAHRFEDVRVYAGSPTRWWLDAPLGFPSFVRETGFELNQFDPTHRAPLKAGAFFAATDHVEDAILPMLLPIERVKFLITSGRTEEALTELAGLYGDPSLDKASLDRLTILIGYSGITDRKVTEAAARHAFRPDLPGGPYPYPSESLAWVLASLGEQGWRGFVIPYLANAPSFRPALDLLGKLGGPSDALLVRPFLDNAYGYAQLGFEVRYSRPPSTSCAMSPAAPCCLR